MYKNTNCFHLAIPCGDLEVAKKFYSETLGCRLDNSAQEWADVDFWGNELTLHKSEHGFDLNPSTIQATRCTSTLVFPDPAPAKTSR